MRRRLIVVCGLGATGKTTLAVGLSRELNVVCLHKDAIKAALFDVGVTTSRSFEIFQVLVEQQLRNEVDLIVEATLHLPFHVELLRNWQQTFDLDLVCIVCHAAQDERRRRLLTRERHAAHVAADQQELLELEDELDYSLLPGRHIDVVTHDEQAVTLRAVLEQLR